MKRVIVMCAVVALAITGPAAANYLWQAAATSSDDTYGSPSLRFGYQAASTAAAQDWTTAGSAYAAVVKFNGGISGTKTALNKIEKWTSTDRTATYLQVWATNDYGGGANMDIRIWLASTNTTGGVQAAALPVKCVYDPREGHPLSGQYLNNALGGGYMLPLTTGGTQLFPTYRFNLPVFQTSQPMDAGQGYIIQLGTETVPEPASILLAIGGIGTLLGMRRRRA
jgi:hypothetical protein